MKYEVICCTNDEEILNQNLLKSSFVNKHKLTLKKGYTNICKAYNEALNDTAADILVFVHQDVFLPDTFEQHLNKAFEDLKFTDWGVLGVAGKTNEGYLVAHVRHSEDNFQIELGSYIHTPIEVQTIDELILITKNNVRFDENMTSNHLFGTDLCLQMLDKGIKNYIIEAYCNHNTRNTPSRIDTFEQAKQYIEEKWKHIRPIHTTCTSII